MAAYVCYRFCCRQVLNVSRSSHVVKQCWQGSSQSSLLRQTGTPVASPLLRFCQTASRFHHGGGRQGRCPSAFTQSRSVLWRSFRSQGRDQPTTKMKSGFRDDRPGLLRPFAFSVFVCGSSFIGCMIWQYETLRQQAQDVMKGLDRQFTRVFEPSHQREMGLRAHMNAMWNNLTDGQKMVMGIISLNFLVFLCWKSPALQPLFLRYFASLPGNPSISMMLSAFSHFNLWHIAANMYVLWSFANVSLNMLGREQWLALYLSAATLSSFASLANKVLRHGALPAAPSLGASGAIMCLLGAVCVTHPDARLSIAFVGDLFPHSFSASSALKGILLLDTVGLVMGWRMFDHAAHLGGALFGIWYVSYGHKMIWGKREKVLKWWHELRGKSSK
ncbi:hypothetical protein ACOMHN_046636 [Nucella lapillus]